MQNRPGYLPGLFAIKKALTTVNILERKSSQEFYLLSTIGGAGGIRTRYLLTASQALSQLSYSPRSDFKFSIKPLKIQGNLALDLSLEVC